GTGEFKTRIGRTLALGSVFARPYQYSPLSSICHFGSSSNCESLLQGSPNYKYMPAEFLDNDPDWRILNARNSVTFSSGDPDSVNVSMASFGACDQTKSVDHVDALRTSVRWTGEMYDNCWYNALVSSSGPTAEVTNIFDHLRSWDSEHGGTA